MLHVFRAPRKLLAELRLRTMPFFSASLGVGSLEVLRYCQQQQEKFELCTEHFGNKKLIPLSSFYQRDQRWWCT